MLALASRLVGLAGFITQQSAARLVVASRSFGLISGRLLKFIPIGPNWTRFERGCCALLLAELILTWRWSNTFTLLLVVVVVVLPAVVYERRLLLVVVTVSSLSQLALLNFWQIFDSRAANMRYL